MKYKEFMQKTHLKMCSSVYTWRLVDILNSGELLFEECDSCGATVPLTDYQDINRPLHLCEACMYSKHMGKAAATNGPLNVLMYHSGVFDNHEVVLSDYVGQTDDLPVNILEMLKQK